MSQIRCYFIAIIAAAMVVSMVEHLCARSPMRRIVMFGCGLFLTVVMLRPLVQLHIGELSAELSMAVPESSISTEIQEENRALAGEIISEQTQTYILDKAQSLGAQIEVQINLRALSETYSYPYEAELTGTVTPAQRRELSEYMEDILGIPGERQIWNTRNQ